MADTSITKPVDVDNVPTNADAPLTSEISSFTDANALDTHEDTEPVDFTAFSPDLASFSTEGDAPLTRFDAPTDDVHALVVVEAEFQGVPAVHFSLHAIAPANATLQIAGTGNIATSSPYHNGSTLSAASGMVQSLTLYDGTSGGKIYRPARADRFDHQDLTVTVDGPRVDATSGMYYVDMISTTRPRRVRFWPKRELVTFQGVTSVGFILRSGNQVVGCSFEGTGNLVGPVFHTNQQRTNVNATIRRLALTIGGHTQHYSPAGSHIFTKLDGQVIVRGPMATMGRNYVDVSSAQSHEYVRFWGQ